MPNKPFTVTVSQLNRRIALMIKGEKAFSELSVRGEISNLTCHYKSGHIYFTLKDETASIKAVMFRSYAENLTFLPEEGMSVTVTGSVQCYERDGANQIYVSSITRDGEGEQALRFEQLKEKLKNEGLFNRKRALPERPEKICVITSDTGAALQDIINILSRRYPFVKLVVIPATVQGDNAPASIVSAFRKSHKTDADIIIFGRGGGASEDLSAFNDEAVARAVYESPIPTISAVGHETDFTICDFVADLRAPTPSAAAEIAVPDISEIINELNGFRSYIEDKLLSVIERKEFSLRLLDARIHSNNPVSKLDAQKQMLYSESEKIRIKLNRLLKLKTDSLQFTASLINAVNPLAVLMRGYSITYKDNKAVLSSDSLNKGDRITVRLHDGEITAVVEERERKPE